MNGSETRLEVGIDGGGGFFKVCLNFKSRNVITPEEKSKRSCSDEAFAFEFKDSGVNKLLILAIVKDICENNHN